MIANQPEAVDDVYKSHEADMVLSRNGFPCVDTFRALACQGLSERKQPARSRKGQLLVIDAPKIGVSDSTEQSPARPRVEPATS